MGMMCSDNIYPGIQGNLPFRQYLRKEFFQMQIMVNLLEREIADIFQPGFGSYIPGSYQLLFEVDLELNLNFAFFDLLIEQPDLLLCIFQGIICDGKQLRVLTDNLNVLCRNLFSVANTPLNKVLWIL